MFTAPLGQHAEFHQAAGCAARRINGGQCQVAERLLGSGPDFARLSNEVGMLLTQAKRGL